MTGTPTSPSLQAANVVTAPALGATASSLPVPTLLGEFELTGVLGEGGFSVVYLAIDHSLDRTVAIKEYMPSAIAVRQPDGSVVPRSPRHEDTFKAGLASFINEARLLARFNHPALIHIHRVWEQHGTAYMVMQYCFGRTLRQVAQAEPELVRSEAWLKTAFTPILDALELLHAQSCFHRDISPDNILILQNGAPVLLDFGAARQVIGDMTQALTVILKPGFAPIEQYADDASLQQGPWTDVYGVGAVIYFLLRGKPPVASVARLVKDPMQCLQDDAALEAISPSFRTAVDAALAVHPDQRIRSISELRRALDLPIYTSDSQFSGLFPIPPTLVPRTMSGDELLLHRQEAAQDGFARSPRLPTVDPTASHLEPVDLPSRPRRAWMVASGGVVAIVSVAAFSSLFNTNSSSPDAAAPSNVAMRTEATQPPAPPTARSAEPAATELASVSGVSAPASVSANKFAEPNSPELSARASAPAATVKLARESSASRPPVAELVPQAAMQASAPPVSTVPPPTPADMQTREMKSKAAQTPAIAPSVTASSQITIRPNMKGTVPDERAPSKTPEVLRVSNEAPASSVAASLPPPANYPAASAPLARASSDQSASTNAVVRLSIRPWGQISVNGQPRGISPPLTRLQLPAGSHTIVITNGEFAPVTKQVQVPDRGEVIVSHRFGVE